SAKAGHLCRLPSPPPGFQSPTGHHHLLSTTTATAEIYTLSLHDALPIFLMSRKIILIKQELLLLVYELNRSGLLAENEKIRFNRSEERFSRNAETDLVCRRLLEKKTSNVTGQRWPWAR